VLGRFLRGIDPYLLMMFATIAFAAILPAQGRGATVAGFAANAGIVFLFFLYGTRISPQAALEGMRHWRLQIAVLLSTFALFPVLGIGLVAVSGDWLPKALAAGFLFLCALPSTVQSSIAFTSIARGNVPAALCAASASSIIGIVVTPLLAGWLLHADGAAPAFSVFRDIVLLLLAPFLAGQLLRPWIGAWVARNKAVLGLADRGSILIIIYVAFSKGMVDGIWGQVALRDLLVLVALLAVLLASVLVVTATMARLGFGLGKPDEIVVQFCGATKSLASGLPMAGVLFAGPQVGLVVLPLMLYHQLQLVVCAVLARRYGARRAPEPRVVSPTP
jgi:sodium/bile acid cotransporter 7